MIYQVYFCDADINEQPCDGAFQKNKKWYVDIDNLEEFLDKNDGVEHDGLIEVWYESYRLREY